MPATAVANADGVLNLSVGGGATVISAAGHLVAGTQLTMSPVQPGRLPVTPTGFVPAAPAVDLTVADGRVNDLLELRFTVSKSPPGGTPVVLHLNSFGRWEAEVPAVDGDSMTVFADTFSPRWPGWQTIVDAATGAANAVSGAVDSVRDWATGRTDPPADCERDPYPWVSGEGSVAAGTVHTCVLRNPRPDGTERVEVKIKSNRDTFQWIRLPDWTNDYLWVEGSPPWLQRIIASALGSSYRDYQHLVLLGPGRSMTVGYTRPVGQSVDLTFAAYQNAITAALTAAEQAIGFPDLAGVAIALVKCTGALDGQLLNVITGSDFDLGAIMKDCAVDQILDAVKSLASESADERVRKGRFLIELGLATKEDLAALSTRIRAMRLAETLIKRAGKVLFYAGLFEKVTNLTADIKSQNIDFANKYTVTLSPAKIVPPPDAIKNFDYRNTTLPAGVCRWGRPSQVPIKVSNGTGHVGSLDARNYSEVLGMNLVGYADVDGDGQQDAVVETGCTGGGTAVDSSVSVFKLEGSALSLVGGQELTPSRGQGKVGSKYGNARLKGTDVLLDEVVQIGDEATCCYTGRSTVTWRFRNGKWQSSVGPVSGSPTAEQAEQAVRAYLLTAGARSYKTAWDMLSINYKLKYGPFENNTGYSKFQQFWNGINSVGIDSVNATGQSDRFGTTLRVDLWYQRPDGSQSNETVDIDIEYGVDGARLQIGDYRFVAQR